MAAAKTFLAVFAWALIVSPSWAQPQADTKARVKAVRDLAKQGQDSVPKIAPYLTDMDLSVKLEAVRALVDLGGPRSIDPLVRATQDPDPEIQIRATDGLVNFYLPGFIKTGISGSLSRVGNAVKAKFTDTNDQIIDAYVQVRPEVIQALGKLARGGASLEARANAARALGILRGRAAVPDLIDALHSKDTLVMYESLVALQKIRDPDSAVRIQFLLNDLDPKIQMAALETTGILRNREAAQGVRDVLDHASSQKVKRAALESLAMIGDPADRSRFLRDLNDKDDNIRAAAAEGLARIGNPGDRPALDKLFTSEHSMSPRISDAFALVAMGNLDTGEFSPLRYLVNTLNSKSWRGIALPFLTEVAREQKVRTAIYPLLPAATKDEKIQLSIVLGRSGGPDSVPYLESLSTDTDVDVASEGVRQLRSLRARLP